ncbi:hypothetical protein, partial [Xanthomonas bonasiae]|uniref:hypothetical protein n=1 Tax=Xanthomonas bonasiae TaxID=2810351 RepID=UPI00197F2B57
DLQPGADGGVSGALIYDAALFDAATAQRWAQWYGQLLHAVVGAPDGPLSEVDLLGEAGRSQLLGYGRGEPARTQDPRPLHAIVAAHALAKPDAVALSDRGGQL